jgi:hypothetical protein
MHWMCIFSSLLDAPLKLFGATTSAVISEPDNSNFDFGFYAFTYAEFKGDYKLVVKALNLQPADPKAEYSIGKFVSKQKPIGCPETIGLTPTENGRFLLGCGWCNGG